MRITTLFRRLLGVSKMFVEEVAFDGVSGLVIRVRPSWRLSRCGICGTQSPRYDRSPVRRWRHLPWGRVRVDLEYAPWRVSCWQCGVRVEEVSWAPSGSRFTENLSELAAYLSQSMDRTAVSRLLGVSWEAIGSIVQRVVAERLESDRFEKLCRIGIDEFSYRKRHRYLTVVVDHDRRRVVWAGEGRSAETLGGFFDLLGEEGCARIELATIDFAGGYLKAIGERLPHARIVFDRFHVERLAQNALDEVRREMVRELAGTDQAKRIKGTRYSLLKRAWRTDLRDDQRISELHRTNSKLYRAYLLKEGLAEVLDQKRFRRARRFLFEWLSWACRSKLKPFVRISRTIRRHAAGVLAYIDQRLTNGLVEGINNKLRVAARRAYGFHSHEPLVAMLFLCAGGIRLDPPLQRPTAT